MGTPGDRTDRSRAVALLPARYPGEALLRSWGRMPGPRGQPGSPRSGIGFSLCHSRPPGLLERTGPHTPEARPPRHSPGFPRRPTPPAPSCLWLERQQRLVPRPSTGTFLNVPSRAASLPDDLCSGTSSSPLSRGKAREDGRGSGPPGTQMVSMWQWRKLAALAAGVPRRSISLSRSLSFSFPLHFWKVKQGSGTYSEVWTELVC